MDQVYQNWENLSATEQVDFLATYPGVEPPAGVVSNFVNPPTRNDIGISVITIFLVLVVITGALRLYSRAAIVRAYRLEDCTSFLLGEPNHTWWDMSAYRSNTRSWICFICA